MKRLPALLVSLLVALAAVAQQAGPISYTDASENLRIGQQVLILTDGDNALSPAEAWDADGYTQSDIPVPNLQVSTATIWVKFAVANQTEASNLLVELAQPDIDLLEFYRFEGGAPQLIQATGENFPFSQRQYHHQNYIFDLNIAKGEQAAFLMKIETGDQILLPLSIGTQKTIFEASHNRDIIFGIFVGILAVMFFYNLFIYATLRDRIYLKYVVYIFFIGITQASIMGYPNQYLWPDWPWMARASVFVFSCFVSISALEFMKTFLRTREFTPVLHKWSYLITGAYTITLVTSLLGFYHISYILILVNAAIISVFMLAVAWVIYFRREYPPAKFFLIAWSALLIGIFVYVMKDFGILPNNVFTQYTMPAGSAIETILLSFALADRINILKREKEESLRENERIVREQNVILERKVKERTEELQESNKELGIALDNLKETQAQLVQAEKMSSLGQLTAGIAHEINNSINFVTANTRPLQRDVDDLYTILNRYDELAAKSMPEAEQAEMANVKKELELDILIEEIATSLNSINEGAQRTVEIAAGLKTFSRVDERGLLKADINAGIRSTVMLLEASLSESIKIKTDLGEIPECYCYANQLNQVFMNLLNNSVDAINDRDTNPGKGTISIRSRLEDDMVTLEFQDDGMGMDQATIDKAFDPFFTTKDVGEGTGLGLSITHGIINNHNGTIEVNGAVGEGATFTIRFPHRSSA